MLPPSALGFVYMPFRLQLHIVPLSLAGSHHAVYFLIFFSFELEIIELQSAADYYNSDLNPIQSGCCRPPTE
jgi:hypothetical protein